MTFKQKTMLTLALLGVPLFVVAAAPANIPHVGALISNGMLTVTWEAPSDATNIDFYRVYFSHASILGNDGNYDDFERTSGGESTYTFKTLPLKSSQIFISVLAVNKDGTESEGFETEASVNISEDASTIAPSTPAEQVSDVPAAAPDARQEAPPSSGVSGTDMPMSVGSVGAISATGVLIAFSKQVSSSTQFTTDEFVITDMSGAALEITGVEVYGTTIILRTAMQEAKKEYQVSILQPIPSEDGTNMPTGDPIHFMSFVTEQPSSDMPSTETPTPSEQQSSLAYIRNPMLGQVNQGMNQGMLAGMSLDPINLMLRPIRRSDGTYNVIAQWIASADPQRLIAAYSLFTSTNGIQYGRNASVPNSETTIQYTRIPPGLFGVKVAAKDIYGKESQGVQKVINLPNSGLGLLGIMAVSGLAAGSRTRRRKTVVR